MRVPLSWLADLVPAAAELSADEIVELLESAGIEVEEKLVTGEADVADLVIGEVLEFAVLEGFRKPIRYCQVNVGEDQPRGIICGASNFAVGDRVVVALPGALLPGDFRITARKTYGHISDGMICSAAELGLGDDHSGILVLPTAAAEVGADAVKSLGLHDTVLVTETTPDRGYQLSMRGIAREIAAALERPYDDPATVELSGRAQTEPDASGGFGIVIDDPTGCDRFVARVLRGLDPTAQSPLWMQVWLARVGMRSISLVVDVTNYLMMVLGQPMHAYDLTKLAGPITVRRAAPGETLTTLDDVRRELSQDDLLITDRNGIQGIAGVMGAADSEISAETTDLLLEAAHWEQHGISRTVRRHGLLSEAGRRYERGVDPNVGPVAIELATRLLVEYGGAKAEDVVIDVGEPIYPKPLTVSRTGINALVGVEYSLTETRHRLEQIGCTVTDDGADRLDIQPPSWRPDLLERADVAEEVARLAGYHHIPSVLPLAPSGRGLTKRQTVRRAVARSLAYGGCVEINSQPFHSADVLDALGLSPDAPQRRLVKVANPLSAQQSYLRSSLLPGLFAAVVRNAGRGFTDLSLYESGTVFREPVDRVRPPAPSVAAAKRPSDAELAALDAALPTQPEHVAAVFTGTVEPGGWWGKGRRASWEDAVAAARSAVAASGRDSVVRAGHSAPWHPGRCAEILVRTADGTELSIGYAGELHPGVCERLELPARTAAMELDLAAILDSAAEDLSAPVVSPYPPATRDVALVVPAGTSSAEVAAALTDGAGGLLEDIRLFDVYVGEQLGEDRKSLAYTLRFRAGDRTLTAEEASAARDAAVAVAVERCSAVQRA